MLSGRIGGRKDSHASRKIRVDRRSPDVDRPTYSSFHYTRTRRDLTNGLADVAAYWAELRIFGGVVLFDRGQTEEEVSKPIPSAAGTRRG